MRYWHPMSDETADQVRRFDPDRIVLLPLYPQFSTTTTASSEKMWFQAAKSAGLDKPTVTVCCYPTEPGFIKAAAGLIRRGIEEAGAHGKPRVLFSVPWLAEEGRPGRRSVPVAVRAHGRGDRARTEHPRPGLGELLSEPGRPAGMDRTLDRRGDRAGRSRRRAAGGGADRLRVRAFGNPGRDRGRIPPSGPREGRSHFVRVPTVGVEDPFIQGLARLVRQALAGEVKMCSQAGGRICPDAFQGCPQRAGQASEGSRRQQAQTKRPLAAE